MAFRSTKARQTAPTKHRVPRRLEQLSPILYKWKPETGFDASTTYAGFSAQNVQAAIPEAVGQGKDGFLTLQDRPHLPVTWTREPPRV